MSSAEQIAPSTWSDSRGGHNIRSFLKFFGEGVFLTSFQPGHSAVLPIFSRLYLDYGCSC